MNEMTKNFKDWENFKTNKTVGIITTILSEQYLEKSYNLISLSPENYIEEIELYDIDAVFFDNEIFESDHSWYKKNRGHIINYLKNEDISICTIKNTTQDVNKIFKKPYVLEINPYIENYKMEEIYWKHPY